MNTLLSHFVRSVVCAPLILGEKGSDNSYNFISRLASLQAGATLGTLEAKWLKACPENGGDRNQYSRG